jgi:hypothetical protein
MSNFAATELLTTLDLCEKSMYFGSQHNGFGKENWSYTVKNGISHKLEEEVMVIPVQAGYIEIKTPSIPGELPTESAFFDWKVTSAGESAL